MASISGSALDETLIGVAGESNDIAGNAGNDKVIGRGSSDLLLGGTGDDTVFGANGHDLLFGGSGNDSVIGGNGGDTLSGDKGDNILEGGNGNDTFVINADIAGQGHDTITDFDVARQLRAMTFNDSVQIKNVGGEVYVFQETSDGKVTLSIDGATVATFIGSNGDLTASDVLDATSFVGGSPKSVSIEKNGAPVGYTINGTTGDDNLSGKPGIANTIAGNAGNDSIKGQGKDDFLLGGPGNDTLQGANGNDTLQGGRDDDQLFGGNGGDVLSGDEGSDTLTGDNGNDRFVLNALNAGVDVITDYTVDEDVIEVKNGGDVLYDAGEITSDGTLIAIVSNTPSDVVFV